MLQRGCSNNDSRVYNLTESAVLGFRRTSSKEEAKALAATTQPKLESKQLEPKDKVGTIVGSEGENPIHGLFIGHLKVPTNTVTCEMKN